MKRSILVLLVCLSCINGYSQTPAAGRAAPYTITSRNGDTFVVTVKWPLSEEELKVIGREVMVARNVQRSKLVVRFRDISDGPKANYKATYEWDFIEDREVGLPEQTRRKIFAEIIAIEDKIIKEIGVFKIGDERSIQLRRKYWDEINKKYGLKKGDRFAIELEGNKKKW